MSILGLPFSSFVLLFVVPAAITLSMFYYSWLIKTGRRE
jgi:hypothetical protein